jgi:DNA-directed RNA polymerase subunit delta
VPIVSLEQLSPEQIQEMSMIELAYEILSSKKQALSFKELLEEISQMLNLSEEQVSEKIAQFYTELNIDGRFISIGDNRWGLKAWYRYEQIEDETTPQIKPKKKKAKILYGDDDDLDMDEFDDLDDEDLVYDDLDVFEDDEEEVLDEEEDFDGLDDEEDFDDELLDDEEDFDLGNDDELDEDLDLDDIEDDEDL